MKKEKKSFNLIISVLNNELKNTLKHIELFNKFKEKLEFDNSIFTIFPIEFYNNNENYYILIAHQDEIILHLARIIDRHKDAKSLYDLLELIKMNPYLFRDKDNEFVKEFINNCKLELNKYNELIKKIRILRDKKYAHLDRIYVYNKEKLYKSNSIKFEEIKNLIDVIRKILDDIFLYSS